MGGHDSRPSFRDRLSDVATATDFWRKSVKIGIPHLHSVHSTMDGKIAKTDARVNTADDTSTSDKSLVLVNFGTVLSEFSSAFEPGGLHAGLCGQYFRVHGTCDPSLIRAHLNTLEISFLII